MAIGSGLSAQLVVGDEGTYGTLATLNRALEFNSESLKLSKGIVQGQGLRSGARYSRASRRAFTTRTVDGSIELDLPTVGAGLLFKHMLGSNATPSGGVQVHVPNTTSGTFGKSLSIQVGRPSASGVVQPFTFTGCKVSSWEIACAVGEIVKLTLEVDGQDEITTQPLATATYAASSGIFHFAQGTLLLGGTASTSAGVTTLSGATAVAAVKGISIKGTNPMAADRFFFGSAGKKAEQIDNDYASVTGNLSAEFTDPAVLHSRFVADTAVALQLVFVSPAVAGGVQSTLEVTLPNINLDSGDPSASGPGVLEQSADFTALDNAVDPIIQIRYAGADTTI